MTGPPNRRIIVAVRRLTNDTMADYMYSSLVKSPPGRSMLLSPNNAPTKKPPAGGFIDGHSGEMKYTSPISRALDFSNNNHGNWYH